jgi:hypothetical protein
MTSVESATLFLSALGVVASSFAVIAALRIANDQSKLTKTVHKNQMLLSQRQLFIQVWPLIEGLRAIDVDRPVGPDVIKAVNVLELVALCWESQMVDANVIKRAFGERYVHFYDEIMKVPNLGNPNKSGSDLIRENPAIGLLFDELRRQRQSAGVPPPLE